MRYIFGSNNVAKALRLGVMASLLAPLLAACSGSVVPDFINSTTKFTESTFGKASPRVTTSKHVRKGGGRSVVGKPYKVAGRWYTPKHDPNYDKTGKASWYGPNFHGRQTANGEIFDQFAISAAHPTLPLPSYVRVTNLANNRSIMVRVNDRGPFVHGREIDLSARAADMLGYRNKGIARVRVKYVGPAPVNGDDTRMLLASYNSPTEMERGQRTQMRVAMANIEKPQRQIAPVQPKVMASPRGNVVVNAQGFNIVTSPLSKENVLGPLFYNTHTDAKQSELAFNSAFIATEAAISQDPKLQEWLHKVGVDKRKVYVALGTFKDRTNAQNVLTAFAQIGAVDEFELNSGAKQLVLTLLKPGVTRADVVERAATLGLEVDFLYE